MKILMLSPTIPWPLNMGSRIRIYHTLRELARAGHKVTFLALSQEPSDKGALEALHPYCKELKIVPGKNRAPAMAALQAFFSYKPYRVAKFESRGFRKEIAQALKTNYDVIWVHFMETLAYLPKWVKEKSEPVFVVDQHNADELMWSRFAERGTFVVKLFARWNLKRFKRFQHSVIHWIDVLLEVSQEETEFMCQRVPPSVRVWTVPNGVDTDYFSPRHLERDKPVVLFCGGLDRLRNVEAVKRFAKAVFPLVKDAVRDVQFWIVGRNPTDEVLALQREDDAIRIFPNVDDVRPFYQEAKVAIAPLRLGGGTKLKVLEALAMGVPVVTTPEHGISGADESYLRVGRTDHEFALHVVQLLSDEKLRSEGARAGLDFVRTHYSWRAIMAELDIKLRQFVLNKKRR